MAIWFDAPFCPRRRLFLRLLGGASCAFLLLPLEAPFAEAAARPPSTPPRKPRAPRVLMLDPGHGGHDPGALARSGLQEKDVTLDIARRMAEHLAGRRNLTVHLTRDRDLFLPLQERVRLGREAKADLFLSVHADSAANPAAQGLSAYTLAEKASDDLASALADRENLADRMGGLDIAPADQEVAAILFDLAARRARNTAQRTKIRFVQSIGKKLPLLEHPVRAANFAVLRSPDVPSILIETGFLSNPRDETLLGQPRHRQKVARAMAEEIARLLDSSLFG